MTKPVTKHPQPFTCKYCGNQFFRYVRPSSKEKFDFCSPVCRNKARAIPQKPCPICGKMFTPRVNDTGGVRKRFCSHACGDASRRKENYIPKDQRRKLSAEEYAERVHGAAKKYMIENNPMKRTEVVKKVQDFMKAHPEKRNHVMNALLNGKQRYQQNNPTKLERKLFDILKELKIVFEPHAIIKPNFVVDARVGKVIIQVDGEYWHGHPRYIPLTERQNTQRKRDAAQDKYLCACGYKVVRVWENEVTKDNISKLLS